MIFLVDLYNRLYKVGDIGIVEMSFGFCKGRLELRNIVFYILQGRIFNCSFGFLRDWSEGKNKVYIFNEKGCICGYVYFVVFLVFFN